jgi:hypothetical protein
MVEEQGEDTMELTTGTADEQRRVELEKEISYLESAKSVLAKALAASELKVKTLESRVEAEKAEFARKVSRLNAKILELSGKPIDPSTLAGSSGGTEEIDPPTITTVVEDGEVRRL